MRLLHTGDWHVAKGLPGFARISEHEAVLAEIAETARAESVDLVLVAGDLFDTTAPSPEAERVVYRALLDLGDIAPVVVVPGNHDNQRRLAAVAPLFAHTNVRIHAFLSRNSIDRVETRTGEVACIALLPWQSQRHIVRSEQLMSKDADDLGGDYRDRMRRIIASLTSEFKPETVNLVLGHVTVAGAELGGGERTAQTIFDYWVDANAFPATAQYVALGHMHRMQTMPGPCPIFYCGSPLQLDFSDVDDNKFALVVDVKPGLPPDEINEVPLSSGRRLRTLTGTVEQLRALAGSTGDDYLRVRVTESARVGLGDEIRDLFPSTVKVIVDSPGPGAGDDIVSAASNPHELFIDYLHNREVEDGRLVALFDELYEEAVTAR
jgi:exonuclease SbcD